MTESENTAHGPTPTYGQKNLSSQLPDLSKRYSYAEYLGWTFKEKVELIRGFICEISPTPARQKIVRKLAEKLNTYFLHHQCVLFFAPFAVRLPDSEKQTDDSRIYNVVQPAICVVCNPDKTDEHGCLGAPDLIIEILSPGNSKKEMSIKFGLYEEAGVKEYWIADPLENILDIFVLQNDRYKGLRPFTENHEVCSVLFPELKFKAKEIFEDFPPQNENRVCEPDVPYNAHITSLEQLDLSKIYSYADYFRWKFEERVELIKGFIHKMSPAPSPKHQLISGNLFWQIKAFLKDRSCLVFAAPFDVRLADSKKKTDDSAVFTVVQPDLCIICDPSKIDERGAIGAPDLVIEVLSPGNSRKDTEIKFDLYEENGVKEYWVVDPRHKTIRLYILTGTKYSGRQPFTEGDEICSVLFPELKFSLEQVFE